MRLDVLLVERGLASSRERAQALILEGAVSVQGESHTKAGQTVSVDANIDVQPTQLPYVSRGGLKLAKALDVFGVSPAGKTCLDVGASTGGFSDVLLQSGAERVYAVDVGHGQLDWKLRQDPRVVVLEKTNIRSLTELPPSPAAPREGGVRVLAELAVVDVSFISLTKVLEPIARLITPAADVIALVKPQFEAGPKRAPKGVVRDPQVHREVLDVVVAVAREQGWHARGLTESPITGPAGNREFLLWLRRDGEEAVDEETIARCVAR
ncbi:MAG TPA: TlyA family RNA methyltransferase [Chloroflexota bacterium]|nr:TlyA family RNA methyltransferase [Chloroflexota bacterium]